jgi:hypothetical protein
VPSVTYEAKLLKDGHLPVPRKPKLPKGRKVVVSVSWEDGQPKGTSPDDPLWRIVGLGNSGVNDAARRHDFHLYGQSRKAGKRAR